MALCLIRHAKITVSSSKRASLVEPRQIDSNFDFNFDLDTFCTPALSQTTPSISTTTIVHDGKLEISGSKSIRTRNAFSAYFVLSPLLIWKFGPSLSLSRWYQRPPRTYDLRCSMIKRLHVALNESSRLENFLLSDLEFVNQ
jgi:hypothetical protein